MCPRRAFSLAFSLAAAGFLLVFQASTLADGKVFHRAKAVVNIPDQEALIHYADGVETLVIETRFDPPSATEQSSVPDPAIGATSEPAQYAWVVPVPGPRAPGCGSVPEVFETTTGVFPTLRAVCAPRITHNQAELAPILLAVCVCLVVWAKFRRWGVVLCVFLIGPFVVLLLLPSLGMDRGGGAVNGVEVISRQRVGSFDVAVVGAESSAAASDLQAWFDAEGFYLPTDARHIIGDYADAGWVFVAAKLYNQQSHAAGRLTPHPLAVRFKTERPVYPMRLTAVGNSDLELDLYVFAHDRAVVDGMRTVRCARTLLGSPSRQTGVKAASDGEVLIAHRELLRLIGEAPVVTKLSGRFRPERMSTDLTVSWSPATEIGSRKYSSRGAGMASLNVVTASWLLANIGVLVWGIARQVPRSRLWRVALASLVPCALLGFIVRVALPVVDAVEVRRGGDLQVLYQACEALKSNPPIPSSLEDVRERFAAEVARRLARSPSDRKRGLGEVREEDSPLSYLIRPQDNQHGYEVVWFDESGIEEVIGRIEK